MNRRSFLTRLGAAAVGAAALAIEDPERLLWVPGAKTIIDLGATKQLLPATDAEVLQHAFIDTFGKIPERLARELDGAGLNGPRDITLTMGGTSYRYKGDQLVSIHTEEELRRLGTPFYFPNDKRRA